MAMTTTDAIEAMMQDDETQIVRHEVGGLEAITRSEVAAQLDAAHRWPRSVSKFLREAASLATVSQEVSEACMYSVPRDGKMITGPSVRLAEMIATSWGNLHMGTRIVDVGDRTVTAQAVAWDLERNLRFTSEEQRNILTKNGKRYGDAMIQTTCAAAASIAYRNAVFRVVPRAYVQAIYEKARQVAVGDMKTLAARRDESFARYAKLGVTPERMFARLGIKGADDFTLEHQELLVGMYTAIKSGELSIDDAFPAPAPSPVPEGTPEGKRIRLPGNKTKGAAAPVAQSEPPPVGSAESKAAAPEGRPKSDPPPKPIDPEELHELLASVAPEWSAKGLAKTEITGWTHDQRAQAQKWAAAVAMDGPMTEQANRPAHTYLIREPGSDDE